jgi:hypothetical protein
MVALGKTRKTASQHVQQVALRLGFDTSHFVVQSKHRPIRPQSLPFTKPAVGGGQSGLSKAANWFLDRGYVVSLPMEPAAYDLVVDSDEGLKRVQVKTTRTFSPSADSRYVVKLTRTVYDPSVKLNAAGRMRQVPYARGSVDYFFLITGAGDMYLIPQEVVDGVSCIVLGDRYDAFRLPVGRQGHAQSAMRAV